ncbi:MAG: NAD-dependent epimerase/dehydratase family protein [Breznakibacter sp.]
MKILITGCAGFIGFHLTKRLLAEGHTIVGIDNLNNYYSPALKMARLHQIGIDASRTDYNSTNYIKNSEFTFIRANIESNELYKNYLDHEHFDLICHLAAQAGVRHSIDNPQQYISSNIQGFFNILEYCRRNPVQKLVFASSSSVYGKNDRIPYSESDATETPVSLYAATKKSNELFAHSYSGLFGINATGLRFFTVYGPWGRPDMAPFIFTKSILEDEPIKVFNRGNMSRDFTYIDDVVEGICQVLLNAPKTGKEENYRIYNVGCSAPVNLNHFIRTIERLSGKIARRIDLPMQPGDVKATWADISLLQCHYGYAPKTPIEKGLKEFINWYGEYYAENTTIKPGFAV